MNKRLTDAVKKGNLFIPFITAGDPVPEATIALALSLQRSGADVLELGIPYSDPLADGPVIQNASKRALAGGMTLAKAMALVPEMRKAGLTIPVIVFTYANPLLQFGFERFCETACDYGIDGLLVPDMPFEESETLANECEKQGLALISLVAPTSQQRIKAIASRAQGFLYCVSSLGVTGARKTLHPQVEAFLKLVKEASPVPYVVGFGISSYEQVEEMGRHADGVVIGSAIVEQIGLRCEALKQAESRDEAVKEIEQYVNSLLHPAPTY
ncbi:tryptophan synthase subunit alpha [Shouchella tritolerans]|uniref:tryptophan synthase subunit alpha n=1 Tax=Shouchella tritolerans TaxID=2979466 RepID=UPI0021E71687|nr:tryptophan synthase subunit alpha [Shouchella tritolerans]